ncbi:1-acyl-sn-glycerol-3-phosphate acyltransferase [Bacillus pseudomycoides]|jgi:1-acyl-sn-glycerol-3-phosphate acyltransferase|uniref:1-acyl-sn-glycerol-3-phosphate acyltransferase n=1 Tax=Bacillus pseudomycoides TaxID=64104 RepID=A0A2A8GWM0_9BACI|nr:MULTISPECIES: 1-acyl-sn-glycerol-3-phosphate acyltransferase [Bacillus]AIK35818.1 1-acylglycerol-3-phosphate O-acyltransferases domain protein [Bacillus pseudomycoides]AJI17009.1 1-acylglycerol-3-phosphate O-acyltransferases domain protein [Bacillus pseudomycoides]KFN14672.1 1-acylglycerol-3-phosphate O-acyltransferases domain protein [Bacillus pseudomycoides]MBD5796218.1 acyl-phosphate glycerol 3-phosphate acyltransferase [Bacillus pseudomycoides]MBJ8028874.1 1-acyl-sn-glycerol-3-phosphate
MYKLITFLLKYIFKTLGKVEVQGKEKLPEGGPYVIACTHTSFMDVLMLAAGMYPTEIHYMAKKELFESKFTNWFFKNVNAFPVDRANPGPSTLKIPSRLLKDGKVVGIFPSGTRSTEDVSLKAGAVTIAMRSNVPLVPAAYVGPSSVKELIKGKRAQLIFGNPIQVEAGETVDRKTAMKMMTDQLNTMFEELTETLQQNKK